jgi:hypothetical protein
LNFRSSILSCWGCQEGTCIWISKYFPLKMIQNFLFLMLLRFKRLYLTSLEELRNWGFVGGSTDSLNYSCIFQKDSLFFCNIVQFQKMIELISVSLESFSSWRSICWLESLKMSEKTTSMWTGSSSFPSYITI